MFDFDSPLIDFEGRPTDAFFAQLLLKVEGVPTAVLAAAQAAPIHSDMQRVRGQGLKGDGSEDNPWNPA